MVTCCSNQLHFQSNLVYMGCGCKVNTLWVHLCPSSVKNILLIFLQLCSSVLIDIFCSVKCAGQYGIFINLI